MCITIPYGDTRQILDLSAASSLEVLETESPQAKGPANEDKIVLQAMAKPYGGVRLNDLAADKKTAILIISDHTRPVPSRHIIPFMLAELRQNNPKIDLTLLVATGCHRGTTVKELVNKLGEKIVAEEKIVVHDCFDQETNVDVGILPSGAHLVISAYAAKTDLLVAEGFIEPHFFAGFSGGRKSVLPGICDFVTVMGNHCASFIDSPYARTGILKNNPIQKDMLAAAKLAGLAYIVNVVIDKDKKVVQAFAGEPESAHSAGCAFLESYCRVKPRQKGDIVITSNGGAPLDQNVYQAVKGLTAAEAAAAEQAVLIICARCEDGAGGESFYRALRDCSSPADLLKEIRQIPMNATKPDQWEYQILVRILEKHQVIIVACPEIAGRIAEMKMHYAPDLETAYKMAQEIVGLKAHTVVIPDGVAVIVDR
ncbi:MAG: nickel-dependent lactate racemase [Desulfitobacteriaceae bacterium]|nr:nickel-dependent lactate racemase [Desulfitobacteriaceae bacterium]MDD4345668.1 nickel-dependent lactate racemase [Desulfitobacteriaceae bacterium]MDD4400520.1 nickel-dependent lactate racemase [Desulfitobacteriaceae bacterium]